MTLIKCKECGKEISSETKQCPNCGAPIKKGHGCLSGCLIVFLIILVIGVLGNLIDSMFKQVSTPNKAPSPPEYKIQFHKTLKEYNLPYKVQVYEDKVVLYENGKESHILQVPKLTYSDYRKDLREIIAKIAQADFVYRYIKKHREIKESKRKKIIQRMLTDLQKLDEKAQKIILFYQDWCRIAPDDLLLLAEKRVFELMANSIEALIEGFKEEEKKSLKEKENSS